MSQAEHYVMGARWGVRGADADCRCRIGRGRVTSGGKNYPVPGGMLETAENLRREFQITREATGRLRRPLACNARLARRRRASSRTRSCRVTVKGRKGDAIFALDEHSARRRDDGDHWPR